MKRSTSIGILGFFLLIFSILGHAQSPVDVSDEIMAANETLMEAIKSGDVEALVSLYSIEARVLPPNSRWDYRFQSRKLVECGVMLFTVEYKPMPSLMVSRLRGSGNH
jgi:hypothetical protein